MTDQLAARATVHGRIRVYCRIRHFDAKELLERGETGVECGGIEHDQITLNYMRDDKNRELKFGFDRVFAPPTTNANVFEEVGRPLVTSVMCGYNATLMAYGQTGSGKTHSLAADDGLINRMVGALYHSIEETDSTETFRVSISYVQIYNERAYDLLHPSSTDKALPLRESKKDGGVYLEGASNLRASSCSELLELLAFGRTRLHFAETKMNRHSSRSHAVCIITVQRTVARAKPPTTAAPASESQVADEEETAGDASAEDVDEAQQQQEQSASRRNSRQAGRTSAHAVPTGATPDHEAEERATAELALSQALKKGKGSEVAVSARLTLVDLAGSERIKRTGAAGTTLAEAQKINLSLLELGNVISALSEQATAMEAPRPSTPKIFVPFRNSTLTRLLQESLGGNCKTSLLLCVSPAAADVPETRGTLQFGSRAMRVRQDAVINARENYEEIATSLAKQLEDKDAVWRRKQSACDAALQKAKAALATRDGEEREQGVPQ